LNSCSHQSVGVVSSIQEGATLPQYSDKCLSECNLFCIPQLCLWQTATGEVWTYYSVGFYLIVTLFRTPKPFPCFCGQCGRAVHRDIHQTAW